MKGWLPRRADSFEKFDKIGQGTYINVYHARDLEEGKIVALKKVRFDNLEPESVRSLGAVIIYNKDNAWNDQFSDTRLLLKILPKYYRISFALWCKH
ncbi:probable serine/threonine-protein kinase at1g54610 [Phtheirospermum japonicum]|uniref:Probable serine/threonine-protein kinase at1g54610 n=1 Tax=Phtheirospermum japonicum TaxID=374723 RepID=A0A830D1R2_9LAMI|nr:probable serine/threonine-protein kinase at1g54610 [Phtheirospermum japonicum]